jgi:hypothetical protein
MVSGKTMIIPNKDVHPLLVPLPGDVGGRR